MDVGLKVNVPNMILEGSQTTVEEIYFAVIEHTGLLVLYLASSFLAEYLV